MKSNANETIFLKIKNKQDKKILIWWLHGLTLIAQIDLRLSAMETSLNEIFYIDVFMPNYL